MNGSGTCWSASDAREVLRRPCRPCDTLCRTGPHPAFSSCTFLGRGHCRRAHGLCDWILFPHILLLILFPGDVEEIRIGETDLEAV